MNLIEKVSKKLNIPEWKITSVINFFDAGSTIPFIARYRKSEIGNLNETEIFEISKLYNYSKNLEVRKKEIINLIEERSILSNDLRIRINNCEKLVELELIFKPYKENKKTKAGIAIEAGLDAPAKIIMSFPDNLDVEKLLFKYLSVDFKTIEEVESGVISVIADFISNKEFARGIIKKEIFHSGEIITKTTKEYDELDSEKKYKLYYDARFQYKRIQPHQLLAILRAQKSKIISYKISIDSQKIIDRLNSIINKGNYEIISKAVKESYKKMLFPSLEREMISERRELSENKSLDVFSRNLYSLLNTAPLKDKIILAIDPAFRSGCKCCIIDETGKPIDIFVIYPNTTSNNVKYFEILKQKIEKYKVDVIGIGNGTASRETVDFVSTVIKDLEGSVKYTIVNESGASVYSASKEAISEFPNLKVEERSAISIARRLLDPLSELVKIDPKSIGVGQYQHDINRGSLDESLTFTIERVINKIGVDLNSCTEKILSFISGINIKVARNIVKYRNEFGNFNSRNDLLLIDGFGEKTFEQAAGFLVVKNGTNPLDETIIHPNDYDEANSFFEKNGIDINNDLKDTNVIVSNEKEKFFLEALASKDKDTRDELITYAEKQARNIDELNIGDIISGVVTNIVDFGIFIDIGLKNDALLHVSLISNSDKHKKVGETIDIVVYNISDGKVSLKSNNVEE